MSARQTDLLGLDRAPVAPSTTYNVIKCICGTRVVVGAGVRSVGCPKCRQIVSGDLLGGR